MDPLVYDILLSIKMLRYFPLQGSRDNISLKITP